MHSMLPIERKWVRPLKRYELPYGIGFPSRIIKSFFCTCCIHTWHIEWVLSWSFARCFLCCLVLWHHLVLEFTQGAQGPQGPAGAPGLKGDGYPGVPVSVDIAFIPFLPSPPLLPFLSPIFPPSFSFFRDEHCTGQRCSLSPLLCHLRALGDYQDPLDQWVYVEWGTLEQR